MTGPTVVIGVDPGPTTGVCFIAFAPDWGITNAEVLQVSHPLAPWVVYRLLSDLQPATVFLAVERFVVSSRAGRSATPMAGQITRDVITRLETLEPMTSRVIRRSAADVKPWASDKRLEAAGLLDITHGMRHARDAARHCLFAAVADAGLPDPLSRSAPQR